MKVSRYKKANKRLNFYINNFGYHQPIQILIDGTFCYAAMKTKFMIEEQLKNYLQVELRFLTTPCIIIETEKLGSKFLSVTNKLKSFQLNKCGHERNPISGADCIKQLTRENRYIISTQDRDLQEWIRVQMGIALLYLHNVVPTLEEPSEVSRKFVDRKLKKSIQVTSFEGEQLKLLKKKEGLVKVPKVHKIKKKKKGGPNPLSCKKKKSLNAVKDKTIDKKKKAKRKLKSNIKEALNT